MIALKEKYKNIIRFDLPVTMIHGWLVSFSCNGQNHKQFIHDDLFGGRLSSLLAAISWRDKTKKRLLRLSCNQAQQLIIRPKSDKCL